MRVSIHLFLMMALLAACSVKKRNYRHGYYIDWAFHQDKKNGNRNYPLKKIHATLPQKNSQLIFPGQEPVLSAATEKLLSREELKKHDIPDLRKGEGCDTLFFRDGKVVAARVLEILPYEIKYKRCDYPDGPMNTIDKNDVAKVIYANGVSEKFGIKYKNTGNEYSSPSQKEIKPEEVKNHEAAYVMMGITISIFLLGILSAIAGLIYAPIALRKIKETKGKFKGEEIIRICKIVCLITLVLFLILLAFLIFLLTLI